MAERDTDEGTHLMELGQGLGPAMRFVLLLARVRAAPHQLAVMPHGHEVPDAAVDLPPVTLLWELAERYHPEQTWLAVLWTRGERSLEEIARTAPREGLARGLIEATRRAKSKGLWSSASCPGMSPAARSPGVGADHDARDGVTQPSDRVALSVPPCGVRASLRNALLAPDVDQSETEPPAGRAAGGTGAGRS